MSYFLLLLPLLFSISNSLQITYPYPLTLQYSNPIIFSVANVGKHFYNTSFNGQIVVSEPYDACTRINSSFGMELPIPDHFEDELERQGIHHDSRFLLVSRGNCTFETKLKNAEIFGIDLVVFVDNVLERTETITIDTQEKNTIEIPAIFIDKFDGEKLKKAIEEESKQISKQISPYSLDGRVLVSLEIKLKKSDKVEFEIFLSSSSTNLRWIRKLGTQINRMNLTMNNIINFQPRYVNFHCKSCAMLNYTIFPDNCISGGRYCSGYPLETHAFMGREYLLEDLRQICIYKNYPSLWFTYVGRYDKSCRNTTDLLNCSLNIIGLLPIINASVILNCVNSSFVSANSTTVNYLKDDVPILKQERSIAVQRDLDFWPSIVINNETKFKGNKKILIWKNNLIFFKGSFNSENIVRTACLSLRNMTRECALFFTNFDEPKPSHHASTLWMVIVLIGLIAIILGIANLWKKEVKRRSEQREIEIANKALTGNYYVLKNKDIP